MLSYQHSYHAGGFADVVKHMTLLCILRYMITKETPLLYLDTHAGRGLYSLQGKESLKTAEAHQGINLLWEQQGQLPTALIPFIELLNILNPNGTLRYYP